MHDDRRPAGFVRLTAGSLIGLLLTVSTVGVGAQDRMPPIPAANMTEAQRSAAAQAAPAGGTLPDFLVPLLRSPEAMLRVKGLGDYVVRSKTTLSRKQTELTILLVLRHWTERYGWSFHYPAAVRAGLAPDVAKAIEEGRRPAQMADDEQVIYDFCMELQQNQSVSDSTYARMVSTLGEQGVIDTIALAGYYTVLSMVFNTTRMPLPPGTTPLMAFPR